jgi:hypothetical protein
MSRYQIAIIGASTGPKYDENKDQPLTKELFDKMINRAEKIITEDYQLKWDQIHLLSGGSAWGEHVAVVLFLKHRLEGTWLTIFSPVDWESNTGKFTDSQRGKDYRSNPGLLLNDCHQNFAQIIERDTFNDLKASRYYGANININYNGFFHRNSALANCAHILLAFSWSTLEMPHRGGTLDIWKKCKTSQKKHISLVNL